MSGFYPREIALHEKLWRLEIEAGVPTDDGRWLAPASGGGQWLRGSTAVVIVARCSADAACAALLAHLGEPDLAQETSPV